MLDNALFYTCSLIEYIGREKRQSRAAVVEKLGERALKRIYEYADVLHSDAIAHVCDQYSGICGIEQGSFDNVSACRYQVPTYWDIGKVFARLVEDVGPEDRVAGIQMVYGSWISDALSNFNSDLYYQSRDYLRECFLEGRVL